MSHNDASSLIVACKATLKETSPRTCQVGYLGSEFSLGKTNAPPESPVHTEVP